MYHPLCLVIAPVTQNGSMSPTIPALSMTHVSVLVPAVRTIVIDQNTGANT